MAPVVEAYQAMRSASFLVSVTFAAEIGDVRRFDTPRQLMAFLGLVPAERSTGYRRLSAKGKKLPVVVAAIAREMAAFLWAIGREVAPT
jgi:transposase